MNFLEEFWPVAFFFVIMGISYARNAAKIKREASQTPPEVFSEEFPQIETPENLWDLSKKEEYGEVVILYLQNRISEKEFRKRLSWM